MTNIKKTLMATVAGVIALGLATTDAKADAYAYGLFNISNAVLKVDGSDITLADVTPFAGGIDYRTQADLPWASTFATDATQSCVNGGGVCSAGFIAEDTFAQSGQSGFYARSDAATGGSLVAGGIDSQVVGETNLPGGPIPAGYFGDTLSQTESDQSVVFEAATGGALSLAFTAEVAYEVDVGTFLPGEDAEVIYTFSIKVTRIDIPAEPVILELAGDDLAELNFEVASTVANPAKSDSWTKDYTVDGLTLVNGGIYQLDVFHQVDVSATAVPEPASLALMGMGLVGLGVARRRMAKKAA